MNTDKIYAEAIANEYSKKETSKVIALKKLDRKAKLPAHIFTYSWGIASSLLLGTGMCFSMGILGNRHVIFIIFGIVTGVLGIVGISINYFLYRKLLEIGKQKYANDIIMLASEISEE